MDAVDFGWGVCHSYTAKMPSANVRDASAFSLNVAVVCEKINQESGNQ